MTDYSVISNGRDAQILRRVSISFSYALLWVIKIFYNVQLQENKRLCHKYWSVLQLDTEAGVPLWTDDSILLGNV
jgi:hypothetical protein